VNIPIFAQYLDETKTTFAPPEKTAASAAPMLDELHRWATALKTLRG
jgi:hypothetical protein